MKRFHSLLLPVLVPLAVSCNPDGIETETPPAPLSHGQIVLGAKLEDPYSVDNINSAIKKLYGTKGNRVEVEATDRYIRVLPRSKEDLENLETLGVQMLDHPMDYEILEEGDWYHDPSVPDGNITWQYAVVPVDFVCPKGLLCQTLDEVYLAEHDTGTKTAACGIDWAAVERESFILTGNADMLSAGPTKKGESEEGTPRGRVTILDPDYDSEPVGVAGVKVCCNVFVKVARAYTDESGYYEMDKSFSVEPRYRLEFQNRKGFCIGFNFIMVKASVSGFGKHSAAGYDFEVTPSSEEKLFLRCAVNNAGYDYMVQCTSGTSRMSSPPSNTRIWIMQDIGRSCAPMFQQGTTVDNGLLYDYMGSYAELFKMFMPDVVIGAKGSASYADIYSRTVHEFAHTSHYMAVGNTFWNKYIKFILVSYATSGGILYGVGTEANAGYAAVGEMWAYHIENLMYKERYPSLTSSFGYSNWFHPQILAYLDARGMDRYRLFAALGSDVCDTDKLKERLLSLYPECKSMINEAFARYI